MKIINRKFGYAILITAFFLVGFYLGLQFFADKKASIQTTEDLIRVTYPQDGQVIENPLIVRGEARGNWYFEATFPITLTDWDGKIIAEWYAEAQDEWMTTEFVPFEGALEFENPSSEDDFTKNGYLILHKSNASGLPEHDDAIEIPIRFK